MIKSIHFKNFKALRDSTLPLGRCTLIIGPNGSGKTTALQGIALDPPHFNECLTAGVTLDSSTEMAIEIQWGEEYSGWKSNRKRTHKSSFRIVHLDQNNLHRDNAHLGRILRSIRVYSLDAPSLAQAVELAPRIDLSPNGRGLAVVLDRLRDEHPERWEALNQEFARWLPEFDQILFDTPQKGHRAIRLRTRSGQHLIPAIDISQGTLLALAILTLAYLPDAPPIVGLEEPDRGIHPRLLRDVRDAMYRLAYPESFGEQRQPVQVIATTHSPYMLDLFRDHPEEIVIAQKTEDNVEFRRLSDLPDLDEILRDSHLGEVWYTGILGGVPTER